jgi:uncharacterized OB-fold protein
MSGVPVTLCNPCGWRGFPERIWCPRCGSSDLRTALVHGGRVEDATILRRAAGRAMAAPVRLGTVRLAGGGLVVARLDRAGVGDRVRLSLDGGAPVARPVR